MNASSTPKADFPEINGVRADLHDIIMAQREFFATGKTRDIAFRRQLLINLRCMLRENEGLLLEALRADLGKSHREGYLTEIGMVEQEIHHTLRHLKAWNSPQQRKGRIQYLQHRSVRSEQLITHRASGTTVSAVR